MKFHPQKYIVIHISVKEAIKIFTVHILKMATPLEKPVVPNTRELLYPQQAVQNGTSSISNIGTKATKTLRFIKRNLPPRIKFLAYQTTARPTLTTPFSNVQFMTG
jgi:hypothetical protein